MIKVYKEGQNPAQSSDKKVSEFERNVVYIVKQGCPICGNDLIGNRKYKFYCKRCNLLFDL